MAIASPDTDPELSAWRRRVRVVLLLDAAERAGLRPLPVGHLHTLAYLSDVLAPVWDLPALDGKVLKLPGGPYYPALQHDVDRLIGMGVVVLSDLAYSTEGGRCRLMGSFALRPEAAAPILEAALFYPDYEVLSTYVREVALALASLDEEEITSAASEDASYADPMVDMRDVIDFGEWDNLNYSVRAAMAFRERVGPRSHLNRGETLHLYVRHIQTRLHASE